MTSCLIGHTGFVGSNLVRQIPFDVLFNSRNIGEIEGGDYDLLVCAGVQAKKWWANQQPAADWAGIEQLLSRLGTVRARQTVLISTVDVYQAPNGVNESTPTDSDRNHAYGRHRFQVEEFFRNHFPKNLTLRLPGLFGHGIKKNVIHDLLCQHETEKINPRGVFQYYSLEKLGEDLQRALARKLTLLNVATEPLGTREIIDRFFPEAKVGIETDFHSNYDMRTLYSREWASPAPGYLYAKAQILEHLEAFLSSWKAS